MNENSIKHISEWTPAIEEETAGGMHEINLKTRLFTDSKIFLTGDITEEMANTFVSECLYLAKTKKEIDIYINSPGGSVNAGLVIYDMIQAYKKIANINMYCVGMAASMAALILAGGQEGRRFILPHSKVMIHEPLISGGLGGSATSIKKTAESILETKAVTNGILSKHTGKTLKEIDKATAFDNLMSAEEAVKFGICDSITYSFL